MSPVNYSNELEQRVLETIMHYGQYPEQIHKAHKAFLKLTLDCFYKPVHSILYKMILDEFKADRAFDFVSMLTLVPKDEHSGDIFTELHWIVTNYGKYVCGIHTFESDINRLVILSQLRKQLRTLEQGLQEVKECPDAEEAQNLLLEKINEVSSFTHRESKQGTDNAELSEKFYDGEMQPNPKIPTMCDQLNHALEGGIKRRTLMTIAAGAGVGKTGFALFLMDAIARAQEGTQCLFFSIEMEAEEIWMRHVGICAGKSFEKLNEDERMRAVTKSMMVPIKIYDLATCRNSDDIDFMVTTARLKAMEKPISVIVVDYLGLVENRGKFERNDLKQADIVTKLSKLSIELNCVVIALSQINRGNAARAIDDRCPWPHDAADSSGSHRSSALWLGVDRPELYQDDPCYRNQFVVKCRKNRFGKIFDLIFSFNDGTFGEQPYGGFRKPMSQPKDAEKAIFSAHRQDFSEKQYVD